MTKLDKTEASDIAYACSEEVFHRLVEAGIRMKAAVKLAIELRKYITISLEQEQLVETTEVVTQ